MKHLTLLFWFLLCTLVGHFMNVYKLIPQNPKMCF